jgi:kynureninase
VGVERIRESSVHQTELLTTLLAGSGFHVTSPPEASRRGGTVTVRTPGFEGVHAELAERGIVCDFRPETGLRLGPHFYNSDDELRFAVGQIAEIVASGAYERRLGSGARF